MNPYEEERALNVYLLFHYGSRTQILGELSEWNIQDEMFEFPVATVSATFELDAAPFERALDLGCAVGRSSFELSRHVQSVIGIDYSESFISAAERIRSGEEVRCLRYSESHLGVEQTVTIPEDGEPDRIQFEAGDAMNLRPDLGQFDLVHAANLLCRLSDPSRLLQRLPDLVKPGGQLVLATPCTWLEEFTPRDNQPQSETLEFLKEELAGDFEFVRVFELPFMIREHSRKFQVSASQTSIWRRQS